MFTRYAVAAELATGKRVLELGCGGGNGMGLVQSTARSLVGGDYSAPLIRAASQHYGSRIPLVRLSAEQLPFRNQSFDLVLFFEASYYVRDTTAAFDEVARVLATDGTVMFVNANPERPDFIHSPHSIHYHTADEFRAVLAQRGFTVSVGGAFPLDPSAVGVVAKVRGTVFGLARRLLETLHLVPSTLRGRARLKRLVLGRLRELPPELPPGFAPVEPRVPQAHGLVCGFKVLYVTAKVQAE
jgi:SAM-dependent methyltransferase